MTIKTLAAFNREEQKLRDKTGEEERREEERWKEKHRPYLPLVKVLLLIAEKVKLGGGLCQEIIIGGSYWRFILSWRDSDKELYLEYENEEENHHRPPWVNEEERRLWSGFGERITVSGVAIPIMPGREWELVSSLANSKYKDITAINTELTGILEEIEL